MTEPMPEPLVTKRDLWLHLNEARGWIAGLPCRCDEVPYGGTAPCDRCSILSRTSPTVAHGEPAVDPTSLPGQEPVAPLPPGASLRSATWLEFHRAGLVWYVNRALHLLGWCLVLEAKGRDPDYEILAVYPARTSLRGFTPDADARGFLRLTRHLRAEAPRLVAEVEEDLAP